LRGLAASIVTLQVLSGSPLNSEATSGSLGDVIFPERVSKFLSSTEDFFVKVVPATDGATGENSGLEFKFPASTADWRDFSIKLPTYQMGVSEFPAVTDSKKWSFEGLGDLGFSLPGVEAPLLSASSDLSVASTIGFLRDVLRTGSLRFVQDWTPAATLLGFVLMVNAVQYAETLSKVLEDERNEKEILIEKLSVASKVAEVANTLREDSIKLSIQVDELGGKLEASILKEKYSKNALEDALKQATGFKTELESLRASLPSPSSASSSAPLVQVDRMAIMQAREKKIVDAVKIFMVDQGYMSPAVAQMLLSSSAAEIIEQASKKKVQSKREKELESQVEALKAAGTGKQGEMEISRLKDELRAAKKYIKEQTAEVDDLKQKLLHSEERFMDEQRQMLSKVDSAKAVAKELNARLETKGRNSTQKNNELADAILLFLKSMN